MVQNIFEFWLAILGILLFMHCFAVSFAKDREMRLMDVAFFIIGWIIVWVI